MYISFFKDKENITGVHVGETLCLQEQNTPVAVIVASEFAMYCKEMMNY